MRNLLEYPVTKEEMLRWLNDKHDEFCFDEYPRVGDMTGVIISEIKKNLENYWRL